MRDFNEPLRRAGSDRISWSREIDLITFARGEEEEEEEGGGKRSHHGSLHHVRVDVFMWRREENQEAN